MEPEDDDRHDHDIAELREDHKRFAALEAQLKLIGRILMGVLASGLGVVGTLLIKWNDIEVSMADLKGSLEGHERESGKVIEQMQDQLEECHDDLKEFTKRQNGQSTKR